MFTLPWSVWMLGLVFSSVLVIAYVIYKCVFAPWRVLKRLGIKGPTPLPFLGNYRDFADVGGINETLKFYQLLIKKFGPISGFYIGKRIRILVADEDVMKQILTKDFESFMNRPHVPSFTPKPYGPNTLFRANGEIWKRDRYLTAPLLHQRKMMIPLIKPSVETLTELIGKKAGSGESFNVYRLFGNYTMETIFAVYLGYKKDLQRGETDEYFEAAFGTFNSPMRRGNILLGLVFYTNFPFMEKIMTFFMKSKPSAKNYKVLYYSTLKTVNARREQGSSAQDLLQVLIDSTGEANEGSAGCPEQNDPSKSSKKGLSDERVAQLAVGNVLGGYENVAVALGYLSYLLAINPDVQEKMQTEIDEYFRSKPEADLPDAAEEIAYLDNVLQEALRMYPPAPRVSHECVKKTTINGVTFPKGCNTIIPIYLFGHDPKFWDEPEKFNPDRFHEETRSQLHQLSHIPFGFGPRYCIGIEYCYLAIKMAVISLLRKYTFVQAPDTEIPLQVVLETVLTPKNGIYLKVDKRN